MSILVVCPGCRKSFKVSEKFAGKSGSCPKCKHAITVPTADQDVKVHTPQAFASGGKTTSGQLVTKPIARTEVKFTPMIGLSIAGSTLVVLMIAFVGGQTGLLASWATIAPALLLISPVLVWAGYTILHDDELQPYEGRSLVVRAAICAVAYASLWALFEYLGAKGLLSSEVWTWFFILPPLVVIGALAALATLDLEFGNGALHFGFYIVVTALLRVVAHIAWPWTQ